MLKDVILCRLPFTTIRMSICLWTSAHCNALKQITGSIRLWSGSRHAYHRASALPAQWKCVDAYQLQVDGRVKGLLSAKLYYPTIGRNFRLFSAGVHLFSDPVKERIERDRKEKAQSSEGSNEEGGENQWSITKMLGPFLLGLLIVQMLTSSGSPQTQATMTWTEFVNDYLKKGEVKQVYVSPDMESAYVVLHDGASVRGQRSQNLQAPVVCKLLVDDLSTLEDRIREVEKSIGISINDAIPIEYPKARMASTLFTFAVLGLLGIALFAASRYFTSSIQSFSPFSASTSAKFKRADLSVDGKKIKFKDVAGLKEAKMEVMEFVDYLKTPERFQALGARIPSGVLLLGPPGCGKTLLAKAMAGEASVPFLVMAGPEFVEQIGGLGASRVRDLFKEAKKLAPCIIYIDEIDAMGKKRGSGMGGGGGSEMDRTLNQLLVEMDGMESNKGIIMLASTNREDVLDKALLRPGRFDRHVFVDFPTLPERVELFNLYLSQLKLDTAEGEGDNSSSEASSGALSRPPTALVERLAQLTTGMSGADIANVCNEGALYAARLGCTAVSASHLMHAHERVVAGMAKQTASVSTTEKNVLSYHEAGHAVVSWLLGSVDTVIKVSIVPRTTTMQGFTQFLPSDKKLLSKEDLFERMVVALGGRAAEAVVFNRVSTGAHDDLRKVTHMAYEQVRSYGMSDSVGYLSFPEIADNPFGSKPFSKRMQQTIDEESQKIVGSAYRYAENLLQSNRDMLEKMSAELMAKETLSYEDIFILLGPPANKRPAPQFPTS